MPEFSLIGCREIAVCYGTGPERYVNREYRGASSVCKADAGDCKG